ncbi:MAG: MinD/ParA family protein [Nitrospinae bacterium]|nr:MinD/ParA family protein [Nitrospinota bacterium]
MDQAGTLRKMAKAVKESKGFQDIRDRGKTGNFMTRGIAVASGKGGVGKTNLVANVAYNLTKLGKKVLVFDADVGLGNIHILLGLMPKHTLQNVDIMMEGPGGIKILPASSGNKKYSELTTGEKLVLKAELESLENDFDFIIFDIGAGISSNVMYFCTGAQEILIVSTPEPTSFADAYAIMKVLSRDYARNSFKLVVNSVKSKEEGLDVFNRLNKVADRFQLNISMNYLGHILDDDNVTRSVREQRLFSEKYPNSPASVCVRSITREIITANIEQGLEWENMLR